MATLDALRAAVARENWIPEPNSGCWLWLGLTAHKGYGQVWVGDRRTMAHRAVYQAIRGAILPQDLALDHRCRNPACVNPDHLEPVTVAENTRRGGNKVRTACLRNGHDLTKPGALFTRKNGLLVCRECRRHAQERHNARCPVRLVNGKRVRLRASRTDRPHTVSVPSPEVAS